MALIDAIEEKIVAHNSQPDLPLRHRFTNGLYSREIFMPAGTLVTSKIHKTQHQFAVTMGVCIVWTKEKGTVLIKAPCIGITEPDTRRVIFVLEDTLWAVFHPNPSNINDLDELEKELILPHKNVLLTD